MQDYNHNEIEKKWQDIWEKNELYRAQDFDKRKKKYFLFEFPYPSGERLHVGHARSYTALDAMARKSRMDGYNTLLPMGWDAFGLPAENYAIKNKVNPSVVTQENIANARKQLKSWGVSIDWSREIDTTDPSYYKWTQWIFLKLLEENLAYQAEVEVNWCPSCKTNLANEEVMGDSTHERCGYQVTQRKQKQWLLKITEYADRLIDDLKKVDFLDKIATQQINWVGRSEGSSICFDLKADNKKASVDQVDVFTTRADTLFGCTYIVFAPESPVIAELKSQIANLDEVEKYIEQSKKKSSIDRTNIEKEKTGVEVKGITAINPINGEEIPVYIADYVIAGYGTGVVMAVPFHDERDWDFAKKYNLPIKEVVIPNIIDRRHPPVDGLEKVERQNVHAIVRDSETGKYLGLKWNKYDWITFPMGGVEKDEDVVEAAKREVEEETGFTDLKLVQVLEGQTRAEYHAPHKNQNRIAYTQAVLFELVSKKQKEIAKDEQEAHDIIWLDPSDLNSENMTHVEVDTWMEKISTGRGAFTRHGILIDSGEFTGLDSDEARKKITEQLKKDSRGDFTINYKLRDWVFSRQRYWGEPIPVIHCDKCGAVPVAYDQLPVELPYLESYEPSGTGESPLANATDWLETKCPKCGGKGRRETDTMPNWAGSNWYYLAYTLGMQKLKTENTDLGNEDFKKIFNYWMPVDLYNGGMEHTTLHLFYSRFIYKFLYDIGVAPTDEPYASRRSHGMILGPDRQKMSKSRGNVINPDDVVEKYGADTFRTYESFIGPFDQMIYWSDESLQGCHKFLKRVWVAVNEKIADKTDEVLEKKLHQTIKKVGVDIDEMRFNTAIASMMEFVNLWYEKNDLSREDAKKFLQILCPFAPHITEELWEILGEKESIHLASWPEYDEKMLVEENIEIVVQENGKFRGKIIAPTESSEEDILTLIKNDARLKSILEGAKKTIFVPGKLVNIVTG